MDEPSAEPTALLEGDENEHSGVTIIDDVRIARTFGPYRILRHVAAGSVGVVYTAEDPGLDKLVAVKFLPEVVRRAPEINEGLFADARAASALGHPGIVRVHDIGRSGGACWLGMELLQPRSAAGYLRDKGRLSWVEATAVAVDCAAALEAAHAADILHRDVKPANILCSNEGTVTLVDFGLAREFPRRGATDRAVSPYASPEQLASEPLDALSDIYSLGATFYALLTGDPPPAGAAPPDPRATVPDVPDACARIITRAMAKDPAERYRSAREMRVDLEAALRPAARVATARHFAIPAGSGRSPEAPGRAPLSSARALEDDALAPLSSAPEGYPATERSAPAEPITRVDRASVPAVVVLRRSVANPWKLVSFVLAIALAGMLLARAFGRG